MTIAETDKPFIDVRTIPPVERHPKIFGMLNALAEGGAFIIINVIALGFVTYLPSLSLWMTQFLN